MNNNIHFWPYLFQLRVKWEMFQTHLKRNSKHTFHVQLLPPPVNHTVYEKMWKNIEEPDRPQMTICHIRIVCRMRNATNTHCRICRTLIFHCKNSCTNCPQCYVVVTVPVFFIQASFISAHSFRKLNGALNMTRVSCKWGYANSMVITGRGQLKSDGTRAETRFRLSAKRTSPFKSAGGVSSVDYWQPRCAQQR